MNHFTQKIFYTMLLLPTLVYGAGVDKPSDLKGLVAFFIDIIGKLIILVFVLTFIAFAWGLIKGWIVQGGSEEGVDDGKKVFLVGLIALVIMSSIWGILALLQNSIFGA